MKKTRHIIYGDYTQESWVALWGLADPKVIEFIDRIKQLNWNGYELYLYGGILLDGETYDIDGTIIGSRDYGQINYLLDGITRIGFEMGIYPDIKWSNDIYDPTTDEPKEINLANYRGYKFIDNNFVRFATLEEGLYMKSTTLPSNKMINSGKTYLPPLRVI